MYLTYTLGVNFSRIMGFLTIGGNKEEWKSILTLMLSFGKFALNTCVFFFVIFFLVQNWFVCE